MVIDYQLYNDIIPRPKIMLCQSFFEGFVFRVFVMEKGAVLFVQIPFQIYPLVYI